LKKFVEEKGGFDLVCKGKRWAEIGRDLGYSGKIMSSLSTSLKNSYQKWLQPYEEWLKQNKPSVLQQQERENGGPYTPSPVPTPAKATLSPKDTASALPAVKASLALHATLQDGPAPSKAAEHQAPPRSVSGFTAVNSGSFTAVNSSSTGFSAINVPNGHGGTGHSTPRQESPAKLAKHTPDGRPLAVVAAVGDAIKAQSFNSLKRQYSSDVDGANGEVGENADSEDASGRRSKRLKQGTPQIFPNLDSFILGSQLHIMVGFMAPSIPAVPPLSQVSANQVLRADGSAPTVTGSHMIQPRLPAQKFQIPRDRSNDQPGDVSSTITSSSRKLTWNSARSAGEAKMKPRLSATLAMLPTIVTVWISLQDSPLSRIGTAQNVL
jgi:[histone H3]-trimethyl-L-lysine4 demethylase